MKAKKLECCTVNGKVFVVDENGILRQCELLPETVMPSYQNFLLYLKRLFQNNYNSFLQGIFNECVLFYFHLTQLTFQCIIK